MEQDYHAFKAEFFKTLAHPLRLALIDTLRHGEMNVSELQRALDVDQSMVSQQLARLRRSNIVTIRKERNLVYYTVRDPMIFDLLDVARQIFDNHLTGTQDMLKKRSRKS